MKSIIINPDEKTIEMVETGSFEEALKRAGLKSGEVDWSGMGHTKDGRHITLMAYEFGLRPEWGPGQEFTYCRIGRQMYAGNLLLFAADHEGENADMKDDELELLRKYMEWLPTKEACEAAITAGRLDRPVMSINGKIVWQWNVENGKEAT